MSREFSIRVSPDLAAWVRRQATSPTRVIAGLFRAALAGRLDLAGARDPGPGQERLTVRIPQRALPLIREAAHSRDNLVALRKLIAAGVSAGTRTLSGGGSSQGSGGIINLPARSSGRMAPHLAVPVRPAISSGRPAFMAYREPITPEEQEQYRGYLASNMRRYGLLAGPESASSLNGAGPQDALARRPTLEVVMGLAVPVGIGALLFWVLPKALAGIRPAASVASGVAAAAKVGPAVAAWTPEAASGLGALFL